ncbi:MAG TPA: hypothetical protein VNL72_02125 [Gammaproteobacteria bacterium]|nr:hypothetical protein [Gammaproteobacteria bacterium]
MHANLDELLSLRDGENVAAATRVHVENCTACAREFARLASLRERLREMPGFEPPPGVFERVTEHLAERREARSLWRLAATGVAAALVVVIALRTVSWPESMPATIVAADTTDTEPSLDSLKRESTRLETWLAALGEGPRVVRADTAGAIAQLQDSIAFIDYRLADAERAGLSEAEIRQLWQRRVELMQSLLTVRYSQRQPPSDMTL